MSQPKYTLSWILPIVRRGVKVRSNFEYGTYLLQLWGELERLNTKGVIRAPAHDITNVYAWNQAPSQLNDAAVEAFFYLIWRGYILPMTDTGPNANIRFYRFNVTERGQAWFDGAEPLPEDSSGYMRFLRDRVPNLDDVIEQYVREALIAFEREAYFAAAVMLGAASEKALYLLADAMRSALKHAKSQHTLEELLKRRKLLQFFEFIRDVIDRNNKPLGILADGAGTHLMSMFEAVRTQRNDAVHPNTAQVSADSVRLLTASFPYALSKSEELRAWLLTNPSSLD